MFFISKKLFLILTAFSCLFGAFLPSSNSEAGVQKLKVVIDAGHGGKDVGTKGALTQVLESDLNLSYAKTLENYFKQAGFQVVLTRYDQNSLSENGLGFHKRKDMEKRKEVIEKVKPDLVISVHMNEFLADKNQSGAQVFYQKGSKNSEILAECVQVELNKTNKKNRITLGGDFFILKDNITPSIIVECGFLSNAEEEKLLQTTEHREKVCYAVLVGVMNYLYNIKN